MGLGVNGRPPDSRAKDREGAGMNRSEFDEPLQADVRKPNRTASRDHNGAEGCQLEN
jgi:hypothetical protein